MATEAQKVSRFQASDTERLDAIDQIYRRWTFWVGRNSGVNGYTVSPVFPGRSIRTALDDVIRSRVAWGLWALTPWLLPACDRSET